MTSSDRLTILAGQIAVPPMDGAADRDRHLAQSREKLARALDTAGVDLAVLPELTSIDYGRHCFERLDDLAEPLDGPSFTTWRQVARDHGTYIVYSFPRRVDGGFRISVAAVGPDGALLGHYDKIHLAQFGASMEKEFFGGGAGLFVFAVKGFKLAPIICYDVRVPELSRSLAIDHGVDAILHCGAYFRDPSFYSWHAFAVTRAVENQVYLLSLNRAGADYGNSLFCPPWIDETSPAIAFAEYDEDFKLLTLERRAIDEARQSYSFLTDRLESYDLPMTASGAVDPDRKA